MRTRQSPTARQSKAGVINCDLGMSKPFDVELERLTSQGSYSEIVRGVAAGQRGTFFLETFGCQMNDHDSEKVAGLLLSRGYQQVETPEAASPVDRSEEHTSELQSPMYF